MPLLDTGLPDYNPNALPNMGVEVRPAWTQVAKILSWSITLWAEIRLVLPDGTLYSFGNHKEVLASLLRVYHDTTGTALDPAIVRLLEEKWEEYRVSGKPVFSFAEIIGFFRATWDTRLERFLRQIESASSNPQALLSLSTESMSREAERFRRFLSRLLGQINPEELANILSLIGTIKSPADLQNIQSRLTPEQRAELGEIMKDPRSRRLFFQDVVLRMTDLIYRETWVRIDAVSFGGTRHGDGGAVVSLPGKGGKPTYLIVTKHDITVAPTLESALDTLSLSRKSLVFTHYLINAKWEILGQIETPLSLWMRAKIFPTEHLIEEWAKNPEKIPEWWSIDIRIINTGAKVSLTHKTKNNWFTQVGISLDEVLWVKSTTTSVTTGWQYRSESNTLTVHASASKTGYDTPWFRDTEIFSLWANWYNTLIKKWGFSLTSWGSTHILAQATTWNWRNPQTGEWKIASELRASYDWGNTKFGSLIRSEYRWAPTDVTPNTFYKLSLHERGLYRFLPTNTYALDVSHILENSAKIWGNASVSIGPLMNTVRWDISYGLGNMHINLWGEKTISKNPFITPGTRVEWGLRYTLDAKTHFSISGWRETRYWKPTHTGHAEIHHTF